MKSTRSATFSNAPFKANRTYSLRMSPEESEAMDTLEGLVRLLKKPSNQRNTKSLAALLNLVRDIKFFKQLAADLSEDAVAQCCLYMTYEYYRQDQYVFRQGDSGSKFYIVLEGKCTVNVNFDDGKGEKAQNEVKIYTKGDAFGELALLNNKPRAASIFCVWDCHLAVLEKNDYTRILAKIHELKMTEKIEFMQALPMFKNWTRGSMQKLTFYFKEKVFQRKQVLFRPGDTPSEVYLIKDGLVQVLKDMQVTTRTSCLRAARTFTVHAELVLLGRGESIGHEEVVSDSKHCMTYICHSTAVSLLAITREDFLKRITSEDSMGCLKALAEVKGDLRQKWLNNLESLEQMKSDCSPPPIPTMEKPKEPEGIRIMGMLVTDDRKSASPDKRDCGESLSIPRLYPFRGVREYDPATNLDAIKSFRRLKSWDQILHRKTTDQKPTARSAARPTVLNIHTKRVKTGSRPQTRGGLVTRSMTMRSGEGVVPCLAINTVEVVQQSGRGGASAPVTARISERIVRSSHSQFRWKRICSLESLPPSGSLPIFLS